MISFDIIYYHVIICYHIILVMIMILSLDVFGPFASSPLTETRHILGTLGRRVKRGLKWTRAGWDRSSQTLDHH